ncbi:RNA polymerase-associated protein RapA [termite gut metagenome]|uniref:RNA polymerase-associated protein RapA n=1 Tax=termite gut metagenome TaxID=433724 RepID=A0A5J4SK19_9ZZZZ
MMMKLVIVLANHPVFGVLLIPYTAEAGEQHTITLVEQAFHASPSIIEGMNEAERKAIAIASCYAEKNLMKVYSKEKNVSDFLRKLPEKTLKEIVRPYIDKKLTEMITLVRTCGLPLYQKNLSSKVLFDHNAYCVSSGITEVSFHFEADESQFRYSLQCTDGEGNPVSLLEKKPIMIITPSPAILLLGRELVVFHDIEASRLIPFTNKTTVSVDASLTEKYIEKIVLPIIHHHDITSRGLNIAEEQRACEALLAIEESVYEETVLRLSFRYGDKTFTPDASDSNKFVYTKEEDGKTAIRYFFRDRATEHRLMQQLKAANLVRINESHFKPAESAQGKELSEWITNHRELLADNFQLTDAKTQTVYCMDEIRMEQNRTDGVDWFELQITVIVGDCRISFTRFRKHILNGIREFMLPDGRMILLPEEWFYKYADLFEYGESSEKTIRLKPSLIGIVNAVSESKDPDAPISYTLKKKYDIPQRLKAQLRRYQQDGFNWMMHLKEHRFGGCLADDMGLGKTLQTLTLLLHTYDRTSEEENASLPASLIVMPTSLLQNWRREAMRFTPLTIYEYTGIGQSKQPKCDLFLNDCHLILTTYGIMRNNIETLKQYTFEYVVLDESQYIKNSDSLTFKAAVQLQAHHRLVLTGTPIENSLKDLWSQFRFLQPDLLGTENDFTKHFSIPIKQGDEQRKVRLQRIIEPFVLRRSKQEVAPELPALTEEIIYCTLTEEQNKVYQTEKNRLRNILLETNARGEKNKSLTVLNGILRLRQLACHPKMVFDDFAGGSGKLEAILSTFETLRSEGHKVLIFSSFVKHLELITEAFTQREWSYALLTGSSTNRQEEIDRFASADNIQAFFISLKAGGVGLNLTQADYVFIIDPWWNPAAEMQAVSRAHRIGQEKRVFAYRFITQGSIEEKIIQLQDNKRWLAETFITDSNPLEALTDEEWKRLLDA